MGCNLCICVVCTMRRVEPSGERPEIAAVQLQLRCGRKDNDDADVEDNHRQTHSDNFHICRCGTNRATRITRRADKKCVRVYARARKRVRTAREFQCCRLSPTRCVVLRSCLTLSSPPVVSCVRICIRKHLCAFMHDCKNWHGVRFVNVHSVATAACRIGCAQEIGVVLARDGCSSAVCYGQPPSSPTTINHRRRSGPPLSSSSSSPLCGARAGFNIAVLQSPSR